MHASGVVGSRVWRNGLEGELEGVERGLEGVERGVGGCGEGC